MEKDLNCAYCMEGELLDQFGIKICELETSKLYLFKEQSHEGRVVVAHKTHIGDMTELSDNDRNQYFAEIAKVAKALHAAFHPDKINFGAYGDTGHHLHFHLVPKYKDQTEWGGVFAMNPGQTYLSEEQYKELILRIKNNL
jgi:diadenosine tetraphosphate (Ap4A) HIT family hydrolase